MNTFLNISGIILVGATFYLPVYLPFLLTFKAKDAETKWSLRISSLAVLALAIIPPPGLVKDTTGQDIAGSLAAASHNSPVLVAWIWGGGLVCHILGAVIGRLLRRKRIRRETA
jgi:hypothetical protein